MPDTTILLVGYLVALAALIAGFLFMRTRLASNNAAPVVEREERRGGIQRVEPAQVERKAPEEDKEEDEEDKEEDKEEGVVGGKLSKADKKKLEKQQRRLYEADKKKQMDERQEKRATQNDRVAEKRRIKQEQRELAEKEAAAAAAAIALEEKKKQDEEDAQWTDSIAVEDAGEVRSNSVVESEQDMLRQFVEYIQTRKVVVLDELAYDFNLRTQDALDRIVTLQTDGRLTGVLDDRGKFLYITPTELEAVARFIKKRGRVNISDIVAESNKVIDLSATGASHVK